MAKQIKNEMSGNRAVRRVAGIGVQSRTWKLQKEISLEIAPVIRARQLAESQGMEGDGFDNTPFSTYCPVGAGEVHRDTCGRGYLPAMASEGQGDSSADLSAENSLGCALAGAIVNSEK